MNRTRLVLKKTFLFLITSSLLVISILIGLFISKEPPILKGEIIRNVTYKENLTLDIYQPTQTLYEKSPVVLYFHGGAWIMGVKEALNVNRFHGAINNLREKGYTIITPKYTLASTTESPFPNCIDDAFDALLWVNTNTEQYGFDLENIGVLGESAGAHIALMLAYTEQEKKPEARLLNYVIDIYGPTDLNALYNMPVLDSVDVLLSQVPKTFKDDLDITRYIFGFNPKLDSVKTNKFTKRFSPIEYVNKNIPPTLIIHGDKDLIVPINQSILLSKKLESLDIEHEIHVLEGMGHVFRAASKQQKEDVQNWIQQFIEKHYQSSSKK